MKKLLALVSLYVLATTPVSAFINNQGFSTGVDYAGAVIAETVEKNFVYVKASAALAAGSVVALDLSADDGATALVGPTSGLAPHCIAVAAIASGAIGKCQIYGLIDAALFDSTNSASVAGKRGYMSTNNAGYISARATEVAGEVPLGYFYDAASASGSVQFFIKL